MSREFVERAAIVSLAGPASEKKYLRMRQDDRRGSARARAFHEAGHAVVGWWAGLFPSLVTIDLDPNVRLGKTLISGGHTALRYTQPTTTTDSDCNGSEPEPSTEGERDLRKASRLAMILGADTSLPSALRTARILRKEAERLVDFLWTIIVELAEKLVEGRSLGPYELEEIFVATKAAMAVCPFHVPAAQRDDRRDRLGQSSWLPRRRPTPIIAGPDGSVRRHEWTELKQD